MFSPFLFRTVVIHAAIGSWYQSSLPSAIFIIKQEFPPYCLKTRYQLFSPPEWHCPSDEADVSFRHLVPTPVSLGSAESGSWLSASTSSPPSEHVFSLARIHIWQLFSWLYTVPVPLSSNIWLCVCVFSRRMSYLTNESPDGSLHPSTSVMFLTCLVRVFCFLGWRASLCRRLASTATREEPIAFLFSLSSLFCVCLMIRLLL